MVVNPLVELMSQYKFAFAWENTNCEDYATEKLSHVFQAGGLPIVDGPDDYSAFVPNNHSVIRVSDFAGPKALADYLRRLENDQALYGSYFTYKPPTSHYGQAFLAFGPDWDIAGKLCRKVAQIRIEEARIEPESRRWAAGGWCILICRASWGGGTANTTTTAPCRSRGYARPCSLISQGTLRALRCVGKQPIEKNRS